MAKTGPFDENSERYEAWFERNTLAYESELRAVKTLLPDGGTCVEIGDEVYSHLVKAGFHSLAFKQTIFHHLNEIEEIE